MIINPEQCRRDYGPQITVYPVGILMDLKVKSPAHALRAIRRTLSYRVRRRDWRSVKNYFNGYLAEVQWGSMEHRRCGHGWTKRRALADLGRHLGEMNAQ